MARFYTRAEQRAYREERRAQAALVADRLMGKKKVTHNEWEWTSLQGGNQMISPFQYGYSGNMTVTNQRTSIIISGMEGV